MRCATTRWTIWAPEDGVLIADDTQVIKKGVKSVGVAPQHCDFLPRPGAEARRAVENTCRLWTTLGRLDWDRFGFTATADRQWIWLDTPDSDHTWPLRS